MLDANTGLYKHFCNCGNVYLCQYKKSKTCPECDNGRRKGKKIVGKLSDRIRYGTSALISA